jgi:hypothetical protein
MFPHACWWFPESNMAYAFFSLRLECILLYFFKSVVIILISLFAKSSELVASPDCQGQLGVEITCATRFGTQANFSQRPTEDGTAGALQIIDRRRAAHRNHSSGGQGLLEKVAVELGSHSRRVWSRSRSCGAQTKKSSHDEGCRSLGVIAIGVIAIVIGIAYQYQQSQASSDSCESTTTGSGFQVVPRRCWSTARLQRPSWKHPLSIL